jgi:putative membrane protein
VVLTMSEEHDPRIYFAGERTLLAWIRSGLAVMGLGFLVARFGMVMFLLRHPAYISTGTADGSNPPQPPFLSTEIGVALVILSGVMIATAVLQHWRFTSRLPKNQLPLGYSTAPSLMLATLLAVVGLVLAVYLVWTSHVI